VLDNLIGTLIYEKNEISLAGFNTILYGHMIIW